MTLNNSIQVDLPNHGILRHKTKDATYIYHVTRSYRDDKGRPTNDRISIGKLDELSGKLIPNKNYYEIYDSIDKQSVKSIKSCGITFVVDNLLKEFGLLKLLKNCFSNLSDKIVAIAEYMLCEGNIMSYYEDWQDEVHPYQNIALSSQDISRIFQRIDYDSRMDFFKAWINARTQTEYIAYDVTSISSYSRGIDALEWGYNRDKEALPQLNFAMYYGEESMLPLYYSVYPGSITDKTHLEYMLRDNELIGCKKMKYVMDRGFFTADNLKMMAKSGTRFIISVPSSSLFAKKLIDKHRSEIIDMSECRLGSNLPYAKAIICEDFDIRLKAHIYYDQSKSAVETERLFEEVERYENELKEMKEAPQPKSCYEKYFKITSTEKKFSYERDNKKINKAISYLGFFIIAETDFKVTSLEVLKIYRQRDVVEKSFDDLKNGIDMKRLFCQSDQTMEGKMFTSFIALITRSCMQNKLRKGENKLSFKSILKELGKIKYVITHDGKTLLTPVTKKQRDILEKFGLSPDEVKKWLTSSGML